MPLPKGTRFRVRTLKGGGKQRLAFKKGTNQVIEVKNLSSGRVKKVQRKKARRSQRRR